MEPPEDYRGRDPDEVLHYMLTKRLGAEVDYIVKASIPNPVLQRRAALRLCVPEGKKCISAQTGTATTASMPVFAQKPELFLPSVRNLHRPVRCGDYIPFRELSYQRWMDAAAHFQPGQRILVKVLDVDRSDRDHVGFPPP